MTDVRRSLRWGAWALGGVMLLFLYRPAALETAVTFGHPGLQRTAYLTSVGAWAVTVVLLVDGGPWPRLGRADRLRARRWTAATLLVLTLGATGASTVVLPADQQPTSTSWAIATNSWLWLAICSGGRLWPALAGLALPAGLVVAATIGGGPTQTVPATVRVLGILGLQVPVALAARALDRSAEAAVALRLREETLRTAQLVADTLHDDRLRRSRAITAVVAPVLTELADPVTGTAPDDRLRRRCGVAGAQVRRLLADWHRDGPDPLGDDLAACLDEIQAAGTRLDVALHDVHARGQLPAPLRGAACDILRTLAADPGTRLRLTAVSTRSQVTLSIVARAAAPYGDDPHRHRPAAEYPPLAVRVTTADNSLWVELTCPS